MPAAPPPLRVLLVDDDPAFTELITCVLRLEGVAVVAEAHDGIEGVELALELEPDVVIMDVRMPVLNGLEATRRILAAAPGSRVLVVSSSKDPEDVDGALAAGASAYLPKERAVAEVHDWIRRLCPEAPARTRDAPARLWGWQALELAL